MKKLAILSTALAVVACSSAQKSKDVSASYVPVAQYDHLTCEQLIAEAESVRRSVPALESAVDKHRSSQTGVEVVTWLLFWPAAFALDKGLATSSQLRRARGELQAIQTALMTKRCGEGVVQAVNLPTEDANKFASDTTSSGEAKNSATAAKPEEMDVMRKER